MQGMKLSSNLSNGMMPFVKWMYKILFFFARVMSVCLILDLSYKAYKPIRNYGDAMRHFFGGEIKVFRRNINIFSRDGLAFLHCYSTLDHASGVATPEIPWCRTTLCFQKTAGEWLVAHQHISVPVDFETKMSKPIHFPD